MWSQIKMRNPKTRTRPSGCPLHVLLEQRLVVPQSTPLVVHRKVPELWRWEAFLCRKDLDSVDVITLQGMLPGRC